MRSVEQSAREAKAHPNKESLLSSEHSDLPLPRYHRPSALHLMAALSVADEQISGQCHQRKRFVDCRSFLETVVAAILPYLL
jgi:hypothetical protein